MQFGNVPGVSTNHDLTNLVHYLHFGAEKGRNVGTVVLTDFSNAFDLVNHTILISKIIDLGVRRNIVPWICDFLHNRQQCFRFNKTLSNYLSQCRCPAGYKTSPYRFSSFNQWCGTRCQGWVLEICRWPHICWKQSWWCQGNLQDDLDDFVDWAKSSGLKLKPKKCQALEVNFTKKKTAPHHADIRIGSDKLPYVDKANTPDATKVYSAEKKQKVW